MRLEYPRVLLALAVLIAMPVGASPPDDQRYAERKFSMLFGSMAAG